MKRLRYYVRLWNGYQRIGFLVLTQYPADTVIWIISMLLREGAGFLGVVTIANVAGGLGSWNLYEICLLFSMCAIIEAMGQAFFDNVWGISHNVTRGLLDVLLVRPAPPFFQLIGQVVHYQAVISMAVYGAVMVYSLVQLKIGFSVGLVLFLMEFIICGTMINSGIYAVFNSLNFWVIQGEDISVLVQTCREFVKYPLGVFPGVIQSFFTFIIPFGFVGFYPASFLTGKAGEWVIYALPVCALLVLGVGMLVWRAGLRVYDSAGS